MNSMRTYGREDRDREKYKVEGKEKKIRNKIMPKSPLPPAS